MLKDMKYTEKYSILIEKEGIILRKVKQDRMKILRMKGLI